MTNDVGVVAIVRDAGSVSDADRGSGMRPGGMPRRRLGEVSGAFEGGKGVERQVRRARMAASSVEMGTGEDEGVEVESPLTVLVGYEAADAVVRCGGEDTRSVFWVDDGEAGNGADVVLLCASEVGGSLLAAQLLAATSDVLLPADVLWKRHVRRVRMLARSAEVVVIGLVVLVAVLL